MTELERLTAEPAPDAVDYETRYQAALDQLRREQPEEAFLAYLDRDTAAACRRFGESEELDATYRILRNAGLPQHGLIMDLGAGNGMASLAFAARGLTVTAVEPCQHGDYGADGIRARAADLNLAIRVLSNWGENLPLPTGTFDAVYVRQCLHHAFDLDQIMCEAARVLKPGGVFLAVREHVVSNESELARFQAGHPMAQLGVPEYAYPLARYLQSLKAAGFILGRVYGPYSFPLHLERRSLKIILGRSSRRVALVLGTRLSSLLFRVAERMLTWRIVGSIMNFVLRPPGRVYSFLAKLPTSHDDSASRSKGPPLS